MIRGAWSLTDPIVPVNISATMVRVGEQKGISAEVLLKNTNIDPGVLSDPKARLSYQQMLFLSDNLINNYPDGSCGLDIGAAINVSQYGMLGYAMFSCSTLRKALDLGMKYHPLVDPSFTFETHIENDKTFIRYTSHIPYEHIYRMSCDVFVSSFATMARFLSGNKDMNPIEVHLNHSKPEYHERYKEFFSCPVLFDQPRPQLIQKNSVLDTPVVMADQATAAMAESQCEEILERMGSKEGVVAKVRKILLSDPGNFPPVDEVASQLATSTRTLSRCLKEVDTSYQKILDEVRKQMAIEYLQSSSLPIEEIAALVGYNDPSNFRKAFRRWTNNAPSYYRSPQHSENPDTSAE